MDFNSLPKAIGEGRGLEPITAEDVVFAGQTLTDLAALKLVYQTALVSQRFVQSKTLVQQWNNADDLYRDIVPAENWPNSKKARSAVPMPVIMEATETLLSQVHMAFFSDSQPFLLDPKGKTTAQAARAMSHALCWATEMCGFEEEIRKIGKSCLLYGTGIGKEGWTTVKHFFKNYFRADGGDLGYKEKEYTLSYPVFEYVSLRNALVNPHTNNQDIRTSKEVIFQKYIDAVDLDNLRKDSDYKNVPTRDKLKVTLVDGAEQTLNTLLGNQYLTWRDNQAELPTHEGSPDPLKRPLELLEYWDDERVVTVLQRTFVIRNEKHGLPGHPFRSCSFIDVLDSFYGFGIAKLLSGEQAVQQGVINKWIDSLSLKLNPAFHRKKGSGAMSQNIQLGPGKVVNDDGDLAPLEIESISEEAMNAIQASESRASRRVGANFGPEMPTQAMRTAEGVNAFTSGVQVKLQYFIENFANLIYVPVLKDFIALIKDNLAPDELKAIISDRDAQALDGIDIMDVYNGQYDVDVLSSVKLAGRRAMLGMLTPIMQMLGQPAVIQSFQTQGKKFNWVELFNQIFEVTGWPGDNLVDDMTDQDKQMLMMQNPAIVKAQTDQQKTAVDHQNALELTDKKGDVQGSLAVVKSALKHGEMAAKPEATKPAAK